ncbi:MAG TPA: helicase-associated domain-containing protein [Planctomycetota bacterium]|nr:helicase-associated domain-containing protein [Planctomycetota bacterium]
MSPATSLEHLSRSEIVELYRYWNGDGATPHDEEAAREGLRRVMTDRVRILERFRALPEKCRDLLLAVMARDGRRASARTLVEPGHADAAARAFEIESVAAALKKRGFLVEDRDKTWVRFHEPMWRIPDPLAETLAAAAKNGPRALETRLSLKSFLRTLEPDELSARVVAYGLTVDASADPAYLVDALSATARVKAAVEALVDPALKDLTRRALDEQGGVMDQAFLERLEATPRDPEAWRVALEGALLGTIFDGDLADVGILLKPGSLVLFHEVVRGWSALDAEASVDEPPEPAADVTGDLERIRDYLDHHVLRVTREGTLYRATARKMETEVLSPGSRGGSAEEGLDFLLEFLSAHDLIRADDDQRLRPRPAWRAFADKSAVERGETLLKYVQEDLRGTKAEFHHGRMRRIVLAMLKDAGAGRWIDLRRICHAARNFYLATLDQRTTAEKYQRRYQYAPVPPLSPPAVLTRELMHFAGKGLARAGLVELHAPEDGRHAVRLTKLGAAVFGLLDGAGEARRDAGLIVTGDLEIIVFPEKLDLEALQVVSRFAKREKADVTLHYRLGERSVQEAVAGGANVEQLLETLVRHGRYEPPQNVTASVRAWAKAVTVLEARKTWLLKAPSKQALDAALRLRELKAVAAERLNDVTLEVTEDPTAVRIAETLRAQGFFLR